MRTIRRTSVAHLLAVLLPLATCGCTELRPETIPKIVDAACSLVGEDGPDWLIFACHAGNALAGPDGGRPAVLVRVHRSARAAFERAHKVVSP